MELSLLTAFVGLLAVLAGSIHHFYVKPVLKVLGIDRVVESVANQNCRYVPSLQACEKIVLHQPSGTLYLACSTPSNRRHWMPAGGHFNVTGAGRDYLATYDPTTQAVHRLKIVDFKNADRGLSVHGMDVVQSSTDPQKLFVYLINHRVPIDQDPHLVGADSVIEIFEAQVGSQTLSHLRTIEDPAIITPNDVVGSPDGQSFYFTNDHGSKISFARSLVEIFKPASTIGFCRVNSGCKIVATGMLSNNGIVRGAGAHNNSIYVANSFVAQLNVFERDNDDGLILTDVIETDRGMDNLSVDENGAIWALGFPRLLDIFRHISNSSSLVATSALRISANTGHSAYFGEKYVVDKVFEDDGTIVSGGTSVVHDARRHILYFHGLSSASMSVCHI
ncbi:hypothetical protein AX16_000741 [Volvariella volvacea WC 439]|nr:hypothetical protein AX16_000741 [Volvariella volvacea WC 439]